MDGPLVAILVAFVVLLCLIVGGGLWLNARVKRYADSLHKRRVGELGGWAAQRGWRYAEHGARVPKRPYGVVGNRYDQHVLTGPHRGHEVRAQETWENDGDSINYYTIVALTLPTPQPKLRVGREGPMRWLREAVGLGDLRVGEPEFDDTFRVRTTEESFARQVLNPAMVAWLLTDDRARELAFEFEGTTVRTGRVGRLDPDRVPEMADYLVDLVERVPAHAWRG